MALGGFYSACGSARTSVNTLSLFMCEHSVRARSAGPAVRTRTPARTSVNAPLWYGAVRPSVRSSVRPTVSTKKHRCKWRIFFKFCTQVCLGVPSINLWFVLSYLIRYAHNSIISDFSIFGIHRVIFLVRVFKFCTFWELVMFLDISSVFYRIPIWLFFTIILTIHLLISLGTLLARENIEGTFWFFSNSVCTCS